MDISESIQFIEKNGTELEKARMWCILFDEPPEPSVLQVIKGLQNEDGGFPFGHVYGRPSSLNSTQVALLWMDELALMGSRIAGRCLQFLLNTQERDGGWDEDKSIARFEPPPWGTPGEIWARIYLSAQSAFWLIVGGYCGTDELHRALDFLRKHQEPSGRFQGFLHATWIATSVLIMAGEPYTKFGERGLAALSNESLANWVDSQISWALGCLSKAGVSTEVPFVEDCLKELIQRRQVGGEWVSEDGEARIVGATLETLKVFKQYGLLR